MTKKRKKIKSTEFNSVKVVNETVRKDIEKSFNIDSASKTEAYYSERYGWTLRKVIN